MLKQVLIACLSEAGAPLELFEALLTRTPPDFCAGKALAHCLAAHCARPQPELCRLLITSALAPTGYRTARLEPSALWGARKAGATQPASMADVCRIMAMLLARFPDEAATPDAQGCTPLTYLLADLAMMTPGRLTLVEMLLDKCPDVVKTEAHGELPLHLVARKSLGASEHGWRAFRLVLKAWPEAAAREDANAKRPADRLVEVMEQAAHGDRVQLEFSVHSERFLNDEEASEEDGATGSERPALCAR